MAVRANTLVLELDNPGLAGWPPAAERLSLAELADERGGPFRALARRLAGRRYRRIYIVSYRMTDVPRRLRFLTLLHAAEVWIVTVALGPFRLCKSSFLWSPPPLRRLLVRLAARRFRRRLEKSRWSGEPLRGDGVLYLGDYAPAVGGIEKWMRHAAEGLAGRGLEVRVVDRYRFGWREFDASSPVPIHRHFAGRRGRRRELLALAERAARALGSLPGRRPSPRILSLIERFLSLSSPHTVSSFFSMLATACEVIAKAPPRSVHVGFGLPGSQVAWLLSAVGGWPYLVYAHGTENLNWGKDARLAPIFAASLGEATRVVCNAGYAADICERLHHTPRERLPVIHPGVDYHLFSAPVPEEKLAELRRRYELPENARLLYNVGRVVSRKGFDMLVRALPEVLAEHPETFLLLGGLGEYLATVRELATEHGVEERVRFLGRVADDEMSAHYRLADLFCMPSRDEPRGRAEGFGIVYIEAGAAGTPALGSHLGGVPDAVRDGETGLLADPRDPSDIAEKINRLLDDDELLRRMGDAARQWAAELDWARVVERTLNLDEEMAREPEATGWRPPS